MVLVGDYIIVCIDLLHWHIVYLANESLEKECHSWKLRIYSIGGQCSMNNKKCRFSGFVFTSVLFRSKLFLLHEMENILR